MKRTAKMILDAYKFFVSPIFSGLGCGCRFHPTCSRYASDALDAHAFPKATALILWRVLRCGPWSDGGLDPILSNKIPSLERLCRNYTLSSRGARRATWRSPKINDLRRLLRPASLRSQSSQ